MLCYKLASTFKITQQIIVAIGGAVGLVGVTRYMHIHLYLLIFGPHSLCEVTLGLLQLQVQEAFFFLIFGPHITLHSNMVYSVVERFGVVTVI